MIKLKSCEKIYEAETAELGSDFINLKDGNGTTTTKFFDILDFSGYELIEGEWSDPEPVLDLAALQAKVAEQEAVINILLGVTE